MTRVSFGAVLNITKEYTSGDWEGLRDLALELEELGFERAFVMDHLTGNNAWIGDNRLTGSGGNFLESWTALAALAASTKRIRLGPLVQCVGFRNPALVAKIASSIDRVSNGRLEFSMGAGWKKDQALAYGYPFERYAVRVRQLDEALTVIRMMWTQKRASFTGRYFSVDKAELGPRPTQHPHPPIWVGGGGERLLNVAAKHANVWDVWCSPDDYERKLSALSAGCDAIGRNLGTIRRSLSPEVFIAKNGNDARRKARGAIRPGISKADFFKRRIIGSPEECVEQISRFVDLGVSNFTPMVHMMSRSDLTLFAEHVVPKLR